MTNRGQLVIEFGRISYLDSVKGSSLTIFETFIYKVIINGNIQGESGFVYHIYFLAYASTASAQPQNDEFVFKTFFKLVL